jgi:hypothetical protein
MIDLCDRSTTDVEELNESMTGEQVELIPGVGPIFIGIDEEIDTAC